MNDENSKEQNRNLKSLQCRIQISHKYPQKPENLSLECKPYYIRATDQLRKIRETDGLIDVKHRDVLIDIKHHIYLYLKFQFVWKSST